MAEFLNPFGSAVGAVYRFNAETQAYETFVRDAPSFLNSLSTLEQGDSLLLRAGAVVSVRQADLLVAGNTQRISLHPGFNFVSNTGASGPIAEILGNLQGLEAAFVLDATTQNWLAYRPGGPAFLTQVDELQRLQPVFLIMSATETWTYTISGLTMGISAAQ